MEQYRILDRARGEFIPAAREPERDRERNPQGVRHPFKTVQDRMPVAQRPRVIAAQQRREKMR